VAVAWHGLAELWRQYGWLGALAQKASGNCSSYHILKRFAFLANNQGRRASRMGRGRGRRRGPKGLCITQRAESRREKGLYIPEDSVHIRALPPACTCCDVHCARWHWCTGAGAGAGTCAAASAALQHHLNRHCERPHHWCSLVFPGASTTDLCTHSLSLSDLPSNNELTCASRAISWMCSLLTLALASLLSLMQGRSAHAGQCPACSVLAATTSEWAKFLGPLLAVSTEVLRIKHKMRGDGRECQCKQNTKTQAGGRV
jgi:hypothetical protein